MLQKSLKPLLFLVVALHAILSTRSPEPLTCGKPEQPPNSTLIAPDFNVGSKIAYRCEDGHLLSGPEERECLSTGFYSAYPPTCKSENPGAGVGRGRARRVLFVR